MKWLALLALLGAQGGREEKGKLRLSVFGREAGTEEFRLETFEDGHTVLFSKARFEIEVQGRTTSYLVDTALTLDRHFLPHLYAGYHKTGAEERLTKVEWRAGIAVVDRKKEVKTSARFVLDNNVYAQLLPILRRHAGGRAAVKVFRPSAAADVEAVVEDKGEVTLRAGERAMRAREFVVTMGALAFTGHLDGQKRLIRAVCPMLGGLAELEGFEGFVPEGRGEAPRPAVVEEEVRFASGALRLSGTVSKPGGKEARPAVILVSGPGPQDRDGNPVRLPGVAGVWEAPAWGGLRRIAQSLSAAGILVLRHDRRGCGKSEGEFATARLGDLAADVGAAVAFLRARDDVAAVGLAGHGEGAVIATLVAARDESIRALFLLAAPGRPLDEVLLEQAERRLRDEGMGDGAVQGLLAAQRRMFGEIRRAAGDHLEIDERRTFIGWMREHFNHDPAAELARVKGAVVIAQGLKDTWVAPGHADLLQKARPDAEVRRFEGLDHRFMRTGEPGGAPADPDRPLDAGFLGFLVDRVVKYMR